MAFRTALVVAICCTIPAAHAAPLPVRFLTRAEAVQLLLDSSRERIPAVETDRFYPDILEKQWYTPYILYAVQLRMIDAEPTTGLLFPHRSTSRAEFIKMLTIAFNLSTHLPYTYKDVRETDWYAPYVGIAEHFQLFDDGHDLFGPIRRVTYDEAVQALERLFAKKPFLKPKNTNFEAGRDLAPRITTVRSTPQIVKESVMKLFRREVHPEETRQEVIALVNEVRGKHGLPLLSDNLQLEVAAQNHAKDMQKRGYFSHFTPEGLDYVDRIRAANYMNVDPEKCSCKTVFNLRAVVEISRTATTPNSMTSETEICGCKPRFAVGENLAKGQLTTKQVVQDWMDSEGHRMNLLQPQFEEIGIGLFGSLWVQTFGRVRFE